MSNGVQTYYNVKIQHIIQYITGNYPAATINCSFFCDFFLPTTINVTSQNCNFIIGHVSNNVRHSD